MYRLPLLAVLLVIGVLCSASTTRAAGVSCTLTCVNQGQSCNPIHDNFGLHGTDCNGGSICNITSTGTPQGTCIALPGPGKPCFGACVAGYICNNSMCVVDTSVPAFGPGTACSSDKQCFFVEDNGSTTQSCVSGKCKYVMDGQHCTQANAQCNILTSYCNSGDQICHPFLAVGAKCNTSSATPGCPDSCAPSSPTASDGTCVAFYSVVKGMACGLDSECQEGLYCGVPKAGAQFGVCSAVANTSTLHKSCTDDNDCTASNREYCHCFSKYGSSPVCVVDVIPSGYNSASKDYMACIGKCELPNGENNESCILSACLKEICQYVQLSNSVSDVLNDCEAQSLILPMCDTLSSSPDPTSSPSTSFSPSMFAPLGLVVVLLLALLGVL